MTFTKVFKKKATIDCIHLSAFSGAPQFKEQVISQAIDEAIIFQEND